MNWSFISDVYAFLCMGMWVTTGGEGRAATEGTIHHCERIHPEARQHPERAALAAQTRAVRLLQVNKRRMKGQLHTLCYADLFCAVFCIMYAVCYSLQPGTLCWPILFCVLCSVFCIMYAVCYSLQPGTLCWPILFCVLCSVFYILYAVCYSLQPGTLCWPILFCVLCSIFCMLYAIRCSLVQIWCSAVHDSSSFALQL